MQAGHEHSAGGAPLCLGGRRGSAAFPDLRLQFVRQGGHLHRCPRGLAEAITDFLAPELSRPRTSSPGPSLFATTTAVRRRLGRR
jgi:hypothetical protein